MGELQTRLLGALWEHEARSHANGWNHYAPAVDHCTSSQPEPLCKFGSWVAMVSIGLLKMYESSIYIYIHIYWCIYIYIHTLQIITVQFWFCKIVGIWWNPQITVTKHLPATCHHSNGAVRKPVTTSKRLKHSPGARLLTFPWLLFLNTLTWVMQSWVPCFQMGKQPMGAEKTIQTWHDSTIGLAGLLTHAKPQHTKSSQTFACRPGWHIFHS